MARRVLIDLLRGARWAPQIPPAVAIDDGTWPAYALLATLAALYFEAPLLALEL
jgi:hypothetical protein